MRCLALLLFLLGSLLCASGCGGADEGRLANDVAVEVGFVGMDPRSGTPVVVLEERSGSRFLPIWIGVAEARAIATELGDVRSPRPGTHDLAKRLIDGLDGQLDRVVVTALQEGVYYALLFMRAGDRLIEIDARPSDAIAIALRLEAPVFVREAVFAESPDLDLGEDAGRGV